MRTVYRREHEDIDSLLKRFKRAVMRAGIMEECNKRRHYKKPGERRREKHAIGVERARKDQRSKEYLANRQEMRQAYTTNRRFA